MQGSLLKGALIEAVKAAKKRKTRWLRRLVKPLLTIDFGQLKITG